MNRFFKWLSTLTPIALLIAFGMIAYKIFLQSQSRKVAMKRKELEDKKLTHSEDAHAAREQQEDIEKKIRQAEDKTKQEIDIIRSRDHETLADWVDRWNKS